MGFSQMQRNIRNKFDTVPNSYGFFIMRAIKMSYTLDFFIHADIPKS